MPELPDDLDTWKDLEIGRQRGDLEGRERRVAADYLRHWRVCYTNAEQYVRRWRALCLRRAVRRVQHLMRRWHPPLPMQELLQLLAMLRIGPVSATTCTRTPA